MEDPETTSRARMRGYLNTGCIKCGGHSKKIARHSNDCTLREPPSRSREEQQWRRSLRT